MRNYVPNSLHPRNPAPGLVLLCRACVQTCFELNGRKFAPPTDYNSVLWNENVEPPLLRVLDGLAPTLSSVDLGPPPLPLAVSISPAQRTHEASSPHYGRNLAVPAIRGVGAFVNHVDEFASWHVSLPFAGWAPPIITQVQIRNQASKMVTGLPRMVTRLGLSWGQLHLY